MGKLLMKNVIETQKRKLLFLALCLILSCVYSSCLHAKASEPIDTSASLSLSMWEEQKGELIQNANDEMVKTLSHLKLAFPEYAADITRCTNPSKLYILPDGSVYAYKESYRNTDLRNEILFATDTDASLYNEGLGYRDNVRYSTSSNSEKEEEGWDVTGYMQFRPGDTLRFRNIKLFADGEKARTVFLFFDRAYGYVTSSNIFAQASDMGSNWAAVTDEAGQLLQCVIPKAYSSEIEFVRIIAKDIRPDSLITRNQLIEDNDEPSGWYELGNLLKDTDSVRQSNIAPATNAEELPSYWLDHLEVKADEIRQIAETVGRNKASFLWYTDAHWTLNAQQSPNLLKYLYRNTPINKTIFGGDIVQQEPDPEQNVRSSMAYLYDWRASIRDLPHHHSVVGSNDDGKWTDQLFDSNYIYAYLMAAEECSDIVRGGDFYYYIDEPNEKTRYLYLDTAYQSISNDVQQQEWLKQTLLSTPAGWHIVGIAHSWLTRHINLEFSETIGVSDAGNIAIQMLEEYNQREAEYANCEGWVEFCIGGDIHVDAVYRTETGIPIIATETDSRVIRSYYPDQRGTINENSVNAVIADYNQRIIHIVRIGRGNNMEIEY